MRFRPVTDGTGKLPADVRDFEKKICGDMPAEADIMTEPSDVVLVRVPGRLDVMGGIADYSGSVVCEGTLANAVILAAQVRDDKRLVVRSLGIGDEGLRPEFQCSVDDFFVNGSPKEYGSAKSFFEKKPATSWAAYVLGAIPVLARESGRRIDRGMNIIISSSIPTGAGISSSAALEVAAMHAINLLFELGIDGAELARLAQVVENRVVGAPCGSMDQIVTTLGHEGHLLEIMCRPGEVVGNVHLPVRCSIVGINSRVKHAVKGSRYGDVRIGAFMGHKIILTHLRQTGLAPPDNDPMNGYVATISPEQFVADFRSLLPSEMKGKQFLAKYGETCDSVTSVDPDRVYKVRSRTEHPIYENARVGKFIDCVRKADETDEDRWLIQAGELMYGSHFSYRNKCGLDSPETYLLVQLARNLGSDAGIFGAKITGGGSGGTVAVMGLGDTMEENTARIVEAYREQTGIEPDMFTGSSPGALEFGHLRYHAKA